MTKSQETPIAGQIRECCSPKITANFDMQQTLFILDFYLLGFKLLSDRAPVKKSRGKSGTIFKFHNILTSRTTLFSLGSEPSHCPVYPCSIPYPLGSHFCKTGMLLGAFAYVTSPFIE